jgi:hypothetical protein
MQTLIDQRCSVKWSVFAPKTIWDTYIYCLLHETYETYTYILYSKNYVRHIRVHILFAPRTTVRQIHTYTVGRGKALNDEAGVIHITTKCRNVKWTPPFFVNLFFSKYLHLYTNSSPLISAMAKNTLLSYTAANAGFSSMNSSKISAHKMWNRL